ncbi:MAG TPA: hypothetical protein VMU24_09940 [Candidatus Acidoferrales bacterium]|nr:hypothetical protein [Candidatus Acidoferrales bacterium]
MKLRPALIPALLVIASAQCFAVVSRPPVGTVLPVRLETTLRAETKPGTEIRATVMQDVALPDGGKIPVGTRLSGHVVAISPNEVTLQFDSLMVKGNVVPVSTSLRAIAAPLDVQDALTPKNLGERFNTPWEGNTAQIGGEVAYRDAELMDGLKPVGKALADGSVLAPLRASPRGCAADPNVQSLWVFSTTACGVYGDMGLSIAHNGKTDPVGQIVLRSEPHEKLLVRNGTGMMLRVLNRQ